MSAKSASSFQERCELQKQTSTLPPCNVRRSTLCSFHDLFIPRAVHSTFCSFDTLLVPRSVRSTFSSFYVLFARTVCKTRSESILSHTQKLASWMVFAKKSKPFMRVTRGNKYYTLCVKHSLCAERTGEKSRRCRRTAITLALETNQPRVDRLSPPAVSRGSDTVFAMLNLNPNGTAVKPRRSPRSASL